MPADDVDSLLALFTEVLGGQNAWVADGVRRAIGREPRDFVEYAGTTAATGIWDLDPAVAS